METKEELVRNMAKMAYEHGVIAEMVMRKCKIEGIPELVDLQVTVEILES